MKRILSILTVVSLILSLFVVSTVNTGAISNTKPEIAQTSAVKITISKTPYETITDKNATVFGFIGDSNGDKRISVLDATTIQRSLAKMETLTYNGEMVSDVDRIGGVTILDATEIQRWIAKMSENEYISHTLYQVSTDTVVTFSQAFEEISSYIMLNGETYNEGRSYSISEYSDDTSISLIYYPAEQEFQISYDVDDYDNEIYHGYALFFTKEDTMHPKTFLADSYTGMDFDPVYDAWGTYSLSSTNPYKFDTNCLDFVSDTVSGYDKVEAEVENSLIDMLNAVDKMLAGKVNCTIGDLLK